MALQWVKLGSRMKLLLAQTVNQFIKIVSTHKEMKASCMEHKKEKGEEEREEEEESREAWAG